MIVIIRENENGVFISPEEAEADYFIIVKDDGSVRLHTNARLGRTGSVFNTMSIDDAYQFILSSAV